jgi:hypothetical protein
VLNQFNISLNYDLVSEKNASNYVSGDPAILKLSPASTSFMPAVNKSVVIPAARSLKILLNKVEELTLTELLKTSDTAESKLFYDGTTVKGPFVLAAYTEVLFQDKPSRVAVFGNSLFAFDNVATKYGDYGIEMLFRTVTWLTGVSSINQKNTIATKYYGKRILDINTAQANQISLTVSIVFPLVILILGLIVWNRRRHL